MMQFFKSNKEKWAEDEDIENLWKERKNRDIEIETEEETEGEIEHVETQKEMLRENQRWGPRMVRPPQVAHFLTSTWSLQRPRFRWPRVTDLSHQDYPQPDRRDKQRSTEITSENPYDLQ